MAGSRKQPPLPATGRILAEVIDRRPTELRRQCLGRTGFELILGGSAERHGHWRAKDNILTTLVVVSTPNHFDKLSMRRRTCSHCGLILMIATMMARF